MLCPVRCVTCGRVLADKYRYFQRRRADLLGDEEKRDRNAPVLELNANGEQTGPLLGPILDALGLNLMCCRRHLMSEVELINII